jgi:hypothetical protein
MLLGAAGVPVQSAAQRSQPTGATTSCSDHGRNQGGFYSLPVHGRRVTVNLDAATAPWLGTRCAGPLNADVAAALASRTVALGRASCTGATRST